MNRTDPHRRYQSRVEQLIASVGQQLEECEGHETSYKQLAALLKDAPATVRRQHFVPIGRKAFMRGHLIHTNEVLVSLGSNYFAEMSCLQALDTVKRRSQYASDNTRAKKEELEQLKTRLNLAKGIETGAPVDADGDAVTSIFPSSHLSHINRSTRKASSLLKFTKKRTRMAILSWTRKLSKSQNLHRQHPMRQVQLISSPRWHRRCQILRRKNWTSSIAHC
ncbi:Prefoldin subunit-domain-containing protein [Chytriomyces sp. MP71]|nr:Prefoldin subunit-domain-containing protein [Chytriomyces sp. MP71]